MVGERLLSGHGPARLAGGTPGAKRRVASKGGGLGGRSTPTRYERFVGPGFIPGGWPCVLLLLLDVLFGCGKAATPAKPTEPPPPVEATAAVDRAVATTGDVITYRVTVERDNAYQVELPEFGADIAGFRILDFGREQPQRHGDRVVESRWYRLRADLVGSYILPPITLTGRPAAGGKDVSVSTSAIFVEVESVLPAEGGAEDIRDIKPLRPERTTIPWLLVTAGLLVLALAVAAFIVLRRRRAIPVPPPPPHEVAFRALDALRGTNFDDPEAVRRFYFGLSEVVRAYVEGRFGLNATDLTTEEIRASVREVAALPPEPSAELVRFLLDTDLVKFAAHRPEKPEITDAYERALGFVETTRPREAVGEQA